jgi:adenine C2-methylase RlmN of 23S rRNA A2503 and tRNA A37
VTAPTLLAEPTHPEVLLSEIDASANFVSELGRGKVEARYVRRHADYFIVYLSSQAGCRKACRMCHLTQTGQVEDEDVSLAGYLEQAEQVLAHYDSLAEPARVVHFNFMSRGEFFANRDVYSFADALFDALQEQALARSLLPRFKISTIFPEELRELELSDAFRRHTPDLYYSLYSVDPAFRRRWLPKALPAPLALAKLARYQRLTRKLPVIHFAFIEGENDSEQSVRDVCRAVNEAELRVDWNVVAYNPHSEAQGREPPRWVIERNAALLAELLPGSRVKLVERVGFDVKASCGMFVGGRSLRGEQQCDLPPAHLKA